VHPLSLCMYACARLGAEIRGGSPLPSSYPATNNGNVTQVLTNLEELWDESQYEEAFNVDSFVSSLK
jgi:hypothetical protein